MTLKKLKGKQEGKPPFQTGDLVLWYDDAVAEDLGAKIQDRYTGPYIVQQGFNNGTYLLKTTQGQVLPRHVHGNKLKIYKSPNLQTNGFLSTYPNELTGTTTGRAVRFRTYMPPPQQ
ncbi:hypothetical protein EDC96DRAFT_549823 [Choanephora cucurbitarum]|nr:hypothetical protein EDC96DRAFT_549823 [Choanephora cucurbitarum]